MPQNSNFRLPCGYRFRTKFNFTARRQITVGTTRVHLGANGDPLGPKNGSKQQKNYHVPKHEFSTTPRSSISAKIRLYGYGAKSQWRHPRVHLGANGVPLGPKHGTKPLNITMPQNSDFRLPRGHRFRPKFDFTVMAPNNRWGPPRVHLGANGVPLGPKNGAKP